MTMMIKCEYSWLTLLCDRVNANKQMNHGGISQTQIVKLPFNKANFTDTKVPWFELNLFRLINSIMSSRVLILIAAFNFL